MTLFVYRPADRPCVKNKDSSGIIWNQTFPDETAYSSCPSGYKGVLLRVCVRDGYVGKWGRPDYSRCVKEQLQNISNQVDRIQSGLAVISLADLLQEMANATESIVTDDQLTVGDLGSCVDIISRIANISEKQQANISTTETEDFVSTVDYLLNADSSDKWASLQTGNNVVPAASVMEAVSTFGKSVVKSLTTDDLRSVRKNNIIVEFRKSPPGNIYFPFISTTSTLQDDFGASLVMRQETITNNQLNERETVDYVATYYKTLSDFIRVDVQETGLVEGQRLASGILALTLASGPQANLDPPLELQYLHNEELVGERTCVFWNFSLPNGGEWSSKGCIVVFADVTTTRCQCDHLTNFAIMMSPYTNVNNAHHKILGIMSIIGCAISITGMAVTVVCHLCCWRSVKSDKSTILVSMCIALILAMILFLAGVEQTSNKTICTVIAVALHYIFLAVFFLMLTEGIAVAMSVLFVFSSSSKLRYLLPIGWGVPAIIVGISTGATQLEGYGNENFCWLSVSNSVLFAFIVPALAVIVANFIIAVLVFRALFSTRFVMNKTRKGKLMTAVRSVAVLAPLLGLTWIFGVLSVNEDTVMFQYFFVIFNSLQGLFIFVFHCLLSKVMRDAIKRKIPCLGLSAREKSKLGSSSNRLKTNPTSETGVSGTGKCLPGPTIDSVTAFSNGGYKIEKNGKDFHPNDNGVSKPDTSQSEFKQNGIGNLKHHIGEKGTYQNKINKTSKHLQMNTNSDSGSHASGSQRDSLSDKSDRFKYMQWTDDGRTSVSFRAAPFGGIRKPPSNSDGYNPARL
ncbi:Brain-specific angiogenesis inhibitor 1 [Mizuhopecten yessoensis]|uniref:Brain-specific angiogenesis inhibitor 1 n=2 Tax=Mizuhopecten yessoensis TaxID=6573 RepID=A0A210QY25_MIZYE|nr:Brain-specific angiogenesis inhibitor 1 [Mizuhopecten yessoensis]